MAEICAYLVVSWLNNRGQCQCGWTGKRRLLRGSALMDVLTHCAHSGHVPQGVPRTAPIADASEVTVRRFGT